MSAKKILQRMSTCSSERKGEHAQKIINLSKIFLLLSYPFLSVLLHTGCVRHKLKLAKLSFKNDKNFQFFNKISINDIGLG